jgi:hypothetical protein
MGKAIIDISTELMRELLFLPDGASVLYSLQAEWPETIRLVIDAPGIPDAAPEHALPQVAASFRREQIPSTVTMLSWGIG